MCNLHLGGVRRLSWLGVWPRWLLRHSLYHASLLPKPASVLLLISVRRRPVGRGLVAARRSATDDEDSADATRAHAAGRWERRNTDMGAGWQRGLLNECGGGRAQAGRRDGASDQLCNG